MKKRLHLLAALIITASALTSCDSSFEESDNSNYQTRSTNAPSIELSTDYAHGAKATFIVKLNNCESFTFKNKVIIFSYSKADFNYSTKDKLALMSSVNDSIFKKEMDISDNNTYYARGLFVSDKNDTLYSNVVKVVGKMIKPAVETDLVFNRAKLAAIVCGHFKESGDYSYKSFGICIGRKPNPTLKDRYEIAPDTAKDVAFRGTFGVYFDKLTGNTLYHVRAYVITSKKDTIYGNNRIFRTTNGGDFSWGWAKNQSGAIAAGVDGLIETAMDSACANYNNYSNLTKYINVEYNTGVQTADCNILGWMRYGENTRYMFVGTAQHEMSHALGTGTSSNWSIFASPWTAPKTALTIRVMMKDMTQNLGKDTQHYWTGGINQKEEVTNGVTNNSGTFTCKGERMLQANCMIVNAMREDGLSADY